MNEPGAPLLQRQPIEEEELQTKPLSDSQEPAVQLQPLEEEEEELQAKENSGYTPMMTHGLQAQIGSMRQGGQPLPEASRAFFEPRFGHDFNHVRIHTDPKAADTTHTLNARAFTLGHHIAFGAGQYAPHTTEGRRLLGHELAHVIQQRGCPILQCLGANPGCSAGQRTAIRQAIFNAGGWLNKAIPRMEARPLSSRARASLRRNFGPTHGVEANVPLITGRLKRARREMTNIPFTCRGAADATCTAHGGGGHAVPGSHAASICTGVFHSVGRSWIYQAGVVLHESFHAAFSNFTGPRDRYSGWHGESGSTATYPGPGTDPLLAADTYTTLVMDLSY